MGMDDRCFDSRRWGKSRNMIQKGGIQSSKGIGVQANHQGCNQAQGILVMLPICWNRILTTSETGMRNREKDEIADLGGQGEKRSWLVSEDR